MNDVVPEPPVSTVPPDDTSYQSMVVPAALLADITTVPGPHLEPFTGLVATAGIVLIVAVTGVLVEDTHPVVVFLASA